MNTVERVARAIDAEAFSETWPLDWPGLPSTPPGLRTWGRDAWNKFNEPRRAVAIKKARAAIAAMREPSEAMVKAGNGALAKVITCRQWTNETRLCVAAAIDAALAEGGGE
jgi:hypothetical protein